MNKVVQLKDDKLIITYNFSNDHLRTLVMVLANNKCVEFENRDPNVMEDVDGNNISWKLCDELVEMGLLIEDEESYSLYYEMSEDGENIVMNFQ